MTKTVLGSFVLVAALGAAAVAGFEHWTSGDIATWEKKLIGRMKTEKVLGEDLAKWGNHWAMITRRTADGESESHETATDYFFCESGEATVIVGGRLVGARTVGEGEARGSGVEGGKRYVMRPGDRVRIPAGMAHQLLVKKDFLYFVVKVRQAGKEAAEFAYWPKGGWGTARGELAGKLAGKTVATESNGKWGVDSMMRVYRTGDGEAELHEKQVDVFLVEQGSASLVVGGKVVGARTTGPGEVRGSSIEGGTRSVLGVGDIVHIPNGVPHQVVGTRDFLYSVLKVTQ
jgi:mannose-6-phosphate isomerase-like protein (cupin superfamily)